MAAGIDNKQVKELALELARIDVYKGNMRRQEERVAFADSFAAMTERLQRTYRLGWDSGNRRTFEKIQSDVNEIKTVAISAGIGLKRELQSSPKSVPLGGVRSLLVIEKITEQPSAESLDPPPLPQDAEKAVQESAATSGDGELLDLSNEEGFEVLEPPPQVKELPD